MTLPRALNVALGVLLVTLAALLIGPRLKAKPEPPGFEELHRAALERLSAGAPDAFVALERARAAIGDPQAAELYGRAIEHLKAQRRDLAEVELCCAARAERERDQEW